MSWLIAAYHWFKKLAFNPKLSQSQYGLGQQLNDVRAGRDIINNVNQLPVPKTKSLKDLADDPEMRELLTEMAIDIRNYPNLRDILVKAKSLSCGCGEILVYHLDDRPNLTNLIGRLEENGFLTFKKEDCPEFRVYTIRQCLVDDLNQI